MTINQFRYRTATILRKIANRISPKSTVTGATFSDLGIDRLPRNALRALVIYNIAGMDRYVRGQFDEKDPFFNKHTMYWESVEIVRQLNNRGYIVDYADFRQPFTGDWRKYRLIIDSLGNLQNAPLVPGQTRIHYATYIHWLTWNRAELERITWFKERTGILMPMTRQLPTILSDEYADYVTYFGTKLQADSFSQKPIKHQLNISAVCIPEYKFKDISKARHNFLWLGGGGLVHKGLDIALEAFARMPNMHLYIAGNLREEPKFWQWASQILSEHPNIHDLGWMDVSSSEFDAVAQKCIGIVYASAAEGGPGSVAQALHWGLIPIVTQSSLVRAENLGYIIKGAKDTEMIDSMVELVKKLVDLPAKELQEKSDGAKEFALKYHTRQAYSESFVDLVNKI